MNSVLIHRSALDAILAHALEARPAECCGVLIGKDRDIVEAVRSPNMATVSHRYEINPAVHIQARREARSRGLGVVGFYHSHPHSSPVPSETDLAEAQYGDELYLIAGVCEGQVDARVFRLTSSAFEELRLTTYGELSLPPG